MPPGYRDDTVECFVTTGRDSRTAISHESEIGKKRAYTQGAEALGRRRYRPIAAVQEMMVRARHDASRTQIHRKAIETAAAIKRNILQPLLVCTAPTI
jgi:hypothetical protein